MTDGIHSHWSAGRKNKAVDPFPLIGKHAERYEVMHYGGTGPGDGTIHHAVSKRTTHAACGPKPSPQRGWVAVEGGVTCGRCVSILTNSRPPRTPTQMSWDDMKKRCQYPGHKAYHRYGGRGITVCERWDGPRGFANFLEDMGERPPGKTLDRWPNPDGNYEPGNCRWATMKEQRHNHGSGGKYALTKQQQEQANG